MYSFDADRKVLTVTKIVERAKSTKYKDSDSYKSYTEYINHIVCEQVRGQLIDALNRTWQSKEIKSLASELGITEEEAEGKIVPKVWVETVRVRYDTTSNYQGYAYNSVFVTLRTPSERENTKEFCIFKIPVMDKSGLLTREGKRYVVLGSLVQDDDITYGNNELKVMTKGGFFNIKKTATVPKMVYNKQNINIFQMLFALAIEEGYRCSDILNLFGRSEVAKHFLDEEKLAQMELYDAEELRKRNTIQNLKGVRYDLSKVRDKMNQVLSIDRALNKILSRDILLPNGECIERDTTITPAILKKLKRHMVNEVYVKYIPNRVGHYTTEPILIPYLRKGTEVLPIIKEYLVDYDGMYLDRNIACKEGEPYLFMIPAGTLIERGFLELLWYNAVDKVGISEKLGGKEAEVITFEKEILGNRHFRYTDVMPGMSEPGYFYLNAKREKVSANMTITTYDIASMLSLYYDLEMGEDFDGIAGRDVGFRRKVEQADVLFARAFERCAPKFIRMFQKGLKDKIARGDVCNPDEMEASFFKFSEDWWHELYVEMKVIQMPDTTNPCSFYSSLNKVVTIVKDNNSISLGMRQMNLGHYGRLCPFETPSSGRLGVVTNKAIHAKIQDGILFTPYYRIRHNGADSYINMDKEVWLNAKEEEAYRIGDITSLTWDEEGKIQTTGRILVRMPAHEGIEKMIFAPVDIAYLDFVNVDPNQTLSHVCQTIPFIGGDDPIRVTFAESMAKQAKCLLDADVASVGTSGSRDLIRESPYFHLQAEYNGEVVEVRDGSITLLYNEIEEPVTYEFQTTECNTQSVITRYPTVREGDFVEAGQTLMTSNYVKEDTLVSGANLIVAFIPKGYNYEDGVYLSERAKHKLTSYGSHHETIEISKKVKSIPNPDNVNKFYYVEPGAKMFDYRMKTETGVISKRAYADKIKGFIIEVDHEIDKFSRNKRVTGLTTHTVSLDILNDGDKIANKHGNKGVVPTSRSNALMETLRNGEYIDVCYNPAGVSSRMNLGQILEIHLGLVNMVLGIHAEASSYGSMSKREVKYLLSYAYRLANEESEDSIFQAFSDLPEALHEHCKRNITWIRHWRGVFNKDGTAWLYNPTFGKEYPVPVLIGVNTINKLAQESEKKEHARAGYLTEPYVEKTDSPTKGASAKGGQRLGPMEIDALLAYGASSLTQECLNERGDNGIMRNNFTVSYAHVGDKYLLPKEYGIRRSTEFFVNVLESLGSMLTFTAQELPNNTKAECLNRGYYTSNKLVSATDSVERESDSLEEEDSLMQFQKELGF